MAKIEGYFGKRKPYICFMVFITGATGLLGARLLLDLLKKGDQVRAFKRKNSNLNTVKKVFEYYDSLSSFENIEWVEGDTLDILSLEKALEGIDHVFHCAAIVSFDPKDREMMMKTNIEGTANVVNACLKAGIKKLCHVSSTAALGKAKNGELITEETEWEADGASWYSKSKYLSELEVWRGREEGLNAVIVNPCIILGPGEWGRSSTNVFTEVWKGLTFYTPGGNAFVDVRDVSKAMTQLMKSEIEGERFLVVSENMNFKDFFGIIAEALGKKPPFFKADYFTVKLGWRVTFLISLLTGKSPAVTKETARTSQKLSQFSNQKIIDALGFEFIPVERSIRETATLFLQDQ